LKVEGSTFFPGSSFIPFKVTTSMIPTSVAIAP
jgi:hypothetical protein